jgi:hypothetical protein
MERTRNKIRNLESFLKFLSVHYKDEFVDEINDLYCAVEEIEVKDEDDFWYSKFVESQKEIEMLRKDLEELSKEYFKK